MFNWKRTPWLAAVCLCSVLAVAAGCGDDDDDDGDGGDLNVRSGTWTVTINASYSGGTGCTGTDGPFVVPIPFCDIDDPGDVGGGEDADCEVDDDGDDIEFHCTETTEEDGCTIVLHSEGTGTFEEEEINMTITSFETVTPASENCLSQADPCTTTTTLHAVFLNEDGCSTKPTLPATVLAKRIARLAGNR